MSASEEARRRLQDLGVIPADAEAGGPVNGPWNAAEEPEDGPLDPSRYVRPARAYGRFEIDGVPVRVFAPGTLPEPSSGIDWTTPSPALS